MNANVLVTVRADDLLHCIDDACSHLAYWGEPDPPWLDRLRAALSASTSDTPSDTA